VLTSIVFLFSNFSPLTTHYSLLNTSYSLLNTHYSSGPSYKIAKLKYNGGGDWYANKTSLPNLIKFCNQNLKMNIAPEEEIVEVGSPEIFSYPFIHMTGHGMGMLFFLPMKLRI
jgi:hypothetical protein